MEVALALVIGLMRRARFVFVVLYGFVAVAFLYAEPRSGWTWFIVAAGAGLCGLFWGLVAFWTRVFTQRSAPEGRNGIEHG